MCVWADASKLLSTALHKDHQFTFEPAVCRASASPQPPGYIPSMNVHFVSQGGFHLRLFYHKCNWKFFLCLSHLQHYHGGEEILFSIYELLIINHDFNYLLLETLC